MELNLMILRYRIKSTFNFIIIVITDGIINPLKASAATLRIKPCKGYAFIEN